MEPKIVIGRSWTIRDHLNNRVEEYIEQVSRGYCMESLDPKDTIAPAIKDLKDSNGISWEEATDLYEMHMRMGLIEHSFHAPFDEEDYNEQQREIRIN